MFSADLRQNGETGPQRGRRQKHEAKRGDGPPARPEAEARARKVSEQRDTGCLSSDGHRWPGGQASVTVPAEGRGRASSEGSWWDTWTGVRPSRWPLWPRAPVREAGCCSWGGHPRVQACSAPGLRGTGARRPTHAKSDPEAPSGAQGAQGARVLPCCSFWRSRDSGTRRSGTRAPCPFVNAK